MIEMRRRWVPLPASSCVWVALCAVLATLCFALAWWPALWGPFQFDDDLAVVRYTPVHSLAGWWAAQPGLRPLLKLSYALNWTLSPAPLGFHLVNLALHVCNGVLAIAWLRRLLPDLSRAAPHHAAPHHAAPHHAAPHHAAHASFWWIPLTVLLWCLHPVTTEAVTYISGRSVSLATLFALLALWAALGEQRFARAWAALFTALALATRETMFVLPLAIYVQAFAFGRVSSRKENARHAWQVTWPSAAVVMLAGAVFLLEPHHQRLLASALPAHDGAMPLLLQLEGWRWFVGQILLWSPPNIDPDFRVPDTGQATWLAGLTGVLVLGLVVIALRTLWHSQTPAERSPMASRGDSFVIDDANVAQATISVIPANSASNGRAIAGLFVLAVIFLLPGNSVLLRLDIANDRHLYLPLLCLLMAAMLLAFRWRGQRLALGVGIALLVLVFTTTTALRNLDYLDERALWESTVTQSPNKSRPWNNLGMACQRAGDVECAIDAYAQAIRLDPSNLRARTNLYFLRNPPR